MKEIYKQIAKQFDKDERVIKLICEHPLLFTKERMEDPNDMRPIMIMYWGKFVYKSGKTLEDKKITIEKYLKKKSIAINKILIGSNKKQLIK